MRALTKSFILNVDRAINTFFSTLLPQALRILVLLVCITWKYYMRLSSHNQLLSIVDERSLKFVYKSPKSLFKTRSCQCAVCLSEFRDGEKVRELECKHVFHRKCVDRWLTGGGAATCPVCRAVVLPKDTVKQYKHEQQGRENMYGFEKELALILLSTLHRRRCNDFS